MGLNATQKYRRGFTLPELLVSIVIMVIMTGLVLPNWRTGNESLALDRSAHKLGQDVRRAQELSQRAQSFSCTQGSISGYGAFFDEASPNSYLLFVECNANNAYNVGQDSIKETIPLESGIEIADINPGTQASIVFIPPRPVIHLNPGEVSSFVLTLHQASNPQAAKTVTITNTGIIDVD